MHGPNADHTRSPDGIKGLRGGPGTPAAGRQQDEDDSETTLHALPGAEKKLPALDDRAGSGECGPGQPPGYFFATAFGSSIVRTWPGFTPRWTTFTPLGKLTTTSYVPVAGTPKCSS